MHEPQAELSSICHCNANDRPISFYCQCTDFFINHISSLLSADSHVNLAEKKERGREGRRENLCLE